MAYKTILNKALQGLDRLITAEYGNELWPCPGAYFAIAHPIYKDYAKLRKYQYFVDRTPSLSTLLESDTTPYKQADSVIASLNGDLETGNYSISDGSGRRVLVQKRFLDLFNELYPKKTISISVEGDKPVKIYNEGRLVGCIMPLKG